ncbi:MAG: hypothetical protein KQJ78_25860 [Deltaproteobacteria bacterium]|nr:hypothetical protein [Deltaproteobacteria bacterium]
MTVKQEYLKIVEENLDRGKFISFVRYMAKVAEHKRCVTYKELEQTFGLNHSQVGSYAGLFGYFCCYMEWPMMNSLIISSTHCTPSDGFDVFQKYDGKDWGSIITECWKSFHVTTGSDNRVNYSGLDKSITEFLDNFSQVFDANKIYPGVA